MLSGCAANSAEQRPQPSPLPTAQVTAKGETEAVATANADAADDPAIWRNATDPAAGLIVGTDKKAGLHVYDLKGADRSFIDSGQVNNVDLRDMGAKGIVVVASDRNDRANSKLALFTLDPATAKLTPRGMIASGAGEAYGVCLYQAGETLHAFMVLKDGTINQIHLDLSGSQFGGKIVRTMKLGTQSEGCAVDDRTGRLYVAEEDVGLWRFDAAPGGATVPTKIAAAAGQQIVADAEGVAIAPEGDKGGYLVVSSQGDNAYAVYRLEDEGYVGRFRIAAGAFGSVEETDGIDILMGDFGPDYPQGLMVAQDGINAPKAQNFKLVSWAEVKRALNLP